MEYILTNKFTKVAAHPFHIVDRSPWPFISSFGLMFTMFGAAMYMHSYVFGGYLLSLGAVIIVASAWMWWRDIIREATFQGHHTKLVKKGLRIGMAMFIVSEIGLFVGFFWAFFHSALAPSIYIGGIWPPVGVQLFNPLEVPLLNTIILLSSGVTVTWAHYSIYVPTKEYTTYCKIALFLTILLGLTFTFFQGVEYLEAPFSMNTGIYGSVFFLITGFHGAHVLVGTIFLIVNFIRLLKNHFTFQDHLGFEFAIWYWHFVDVVWIFVYLFLYSHLFMFPVI